MQLLASDKISNKTYPVQRAWIIKFVLARMPYTVACGVALAVLATAYSLQSIGSELSLSVFAAIAISTWLPLSLIDMAVDLIWKRNFCFCVEPDHMTIVPNYLGTSKNNTLQYHSIKNVRIYRGILDRPFGLADVVLDLDSAAFDLRIRPDAMRFVLMFSPFIGYQVRLFGQNPDKAAHLVEVLSGLSQGHGGTLLGNYATTPSFPPHRA
ncbi:MAG: PH domain-containing protein [Minisyncoccia bacterium]